MEAGDSTSNKVANAGFLGVLGEALSDTRSGGVPTEHAGIPTEAIAPELVSKLSWYLGIACIPTELAGILLDDATAPALTGSKVAVASMPHGA